MQAPSSLKRTVTRQRRKPAMEGRRDHQVQDLFAGIHSCLSMRAGPTQDRATDSFSIKQSPGKTMPLGRHKKRRPTVQDALNFISEGTFSVAHHDFVSREDREKKLQELGREIEALLKYHLPRARNLVLVILVCHIILAFMLNKFIEFAAAGQQIYRESVFPSPRSSLSSICSAFLLVQPLFPA